MARHHDPESPRWPPPFHTPSFNSSKPRVPPCRFSSLPPAPTHHTHLSPWPTCWATPLRTRWGWGAGCGGLCAGPPLQRAPADARVCPPAPVAASDGACPGRSGLLIASLQWRACKPCGLRVCPVWEILRLIGHHFTILRARAVLLAGGAVPRHACRAGGTHNSRPPVLLPHSQPLPHTPCCLCSMRRS